jgi:cell division protein FtsB
MASLLTAAARRLRPARALGPQLVVILLVLGLAGAMAIEPTRQLLEQRDRIEGMQEDLARTRVANRALKRRIERLNDPDFLEQAGRELGLIRPGERAYVVLPPTRRASRRRDPGPRRHGAGGDGRPDFLDRALHFIVG